MAESKFFERRFAVLKKLYEKFFYIPKYGKVTETVFKTRTILSVLSCLLCMVMLCSATYAYFTASVTASANTMTAGRYTLSVTDASQAPVSQPYVCGGAQDDLYVFTLTPNGTADMGYCKVVIAADGGEQTYYTEQISLSGKNGTAQSLTLKIRAAQGCQITFQPQWGTSANFAVDQGALYGGDKAIEHSITTNTFRLPPPVQEDDDDADAEAAGAPSEQVTTPTESVPAETEAAPTQQSTAETTAATEAQTITEDNGE